MVRRARIVVSLAGPFAVTQAPLLDACLSGGARAAEASVMVMPGAGFGVVPTDIAAALAAERLSGATSLAIYYATEGGASRGTLKTVLLDIDTPGVATVDTYTVFPAPVVQMMRGRLLWLRDLALRSLRWLPEGPSERQLARGRTVVQAVASRGTERAAVGLVGPEAYLFTALTVAAPTERVLGGEAPVGFQTPSVYGRSLLAEIEGVRWHEPARL